MSRAITNRACAAAFLLALSGSAGLAQADFPFTAYPVELDFSDPDAGVRFQALVEELSQHSFVYIDWRLQSAWRSEVFAVVDGAAAEAEQTDPEADPDFCETAYGGLPGEGSQVTFSGRPNPDDNHLIFALTVRVSSDDPFATARCEYFHSSSGLRISGFFYVTDFGIATARRYELRPVAVAADRIPADFFRGGTP